MSDTLETPAALEKVAYAVKCRACRGKGRRTYFSCQICTDRVDIYSKGDPPGTPLPPGIKVPQRLTEQQLLRLPSPPVWPCGHAAFIGTILDAFQEIIECERCHGTGKASILLPAAVAEARKARKRAKAEATKKRILSSAGYKVLCGAHTHRGTICKMPVIQGRSRCLIHGGLSTGPNKSPEAEQWLQAARAKYSKRHRQEASP